MECNKNYQALNEVISKCTLQLNNTDLQQQEYHTQRRDIEEHFERCIHALEARRAFLLGKFDTIAHERIQANSTKWHTHVSVCQEILKTGSNVFPTSPTLADSMWHGALNLDAPVTNSTIGIDVKLPDILDMISAHGSVEQKSSSVSAGAEQVTSTPNSPMNIKPIDNNQPMAKSEPKGPPPLPSKPSPPVSPPTAKVLPQPAAVVPTTLRTRVVAAKNKIPFLQGDSPKLVEFWELWLGSIPLASELKAGMKSEYFVSISSDLQHLTWRAAGPQNIFIQKMVDFFWNVGAPDLEIDKLNEMGGIINPAKIGSWIDISGKGGMDGGWYFPIETPLKLAIKASDDCDTIKKLIKWAESNNATPCLSFGRDMGTAPPQQSEFQFKLANSDFKNQVRIATEAFSVFGCPKLTKDAIARISEAKSVEPINISVATCNNGFVRLGIMLPNPSTPVVWSFCTLVEGSRGSDIARFETALESKGPSFVELQYRMKGYGYGVYKEGLDVILHYAIGEELGN